MERYITEFDTSKIKNIKVDTVIVGIGLAGLRVALELDKLNVNYLVISKNDIKISNSILAQGGIAVAFSPDDTPQEHFEDTIRSGKGLCIEENVKILVDEGIQRVGELLEVFKVDFDKDKKNRPLLTREGAHTKPRIIHYKDETGKKIIEDLFRYFNKKRILVGYQLEEIFIEDNKFIGALFKRNNEYIVIYAKSLVLATGGYSPVYLRNTSAYKNNGDVLGIALRSGLILKDLEFVQFHPTALYIEGNEEEAQLISEAVRGEGGILINSDGERFIDELKTRDEVARAIFLQYQKGKKVFLDISQIKNFEKRFSTIAKLLKEKDIKDKIPVSPATHYSIGGIETNSYGETNVKGIFAIGEVACTGINGANRLASNSLLECLVFGYRVAFSIYKYNLFTEEPKVIKFVNRTNKKDYLTEEKFEEYLVKIKKIMWDKVSLIRDENGLKNALNDLVNIEKEIFKYHNTRYIKDIVLLCKGIILSALNRKESRGAHYRKDYPVERDKYKKHTKIYKNLEIKLEVS
ncbi:MAG: L-aspartate oxidase [Persephonella sp.]|nr:MAG: L-aspartate oxidase [Persephonella sp.]RUM60857.1 MAG: L-aspartate oxidase [Persephonella sp.]